MNIIYLISKYVTVVGTVLKGFWEHLFCRIIGIPVQDARYLQPNELCGHVEHDFTKKKGETFLVCYLPGLMNRLFGYGMIFGGFVGTFYIKPAQTSIIFWVYIVMLYLGISFMCNNAPLCEDALNNWDKLYGKDSDAKLAAKIFAFIPSVYFRLSAWMEKYALSFVIYVILVVLLAVFA